MSVCRPGGPETAITCLNNQDNDCNGLAGYADPACSAFLPSPSPAPPGQAVVNTLGLHFSVIGECQRVHCTVQAAPWRCS